MRFGGSNISKGCNIFGGNGVSQGPGISGGYGGSSRFAVMLVGLADLADPVKVAEPIECRFCGSSLFG